MHAMSVDVRIDPARAQEARDGLAHLVPRVKAAPGFVRGTWYGDDESGHSVVLFDSAEHAEQMVQMISAQPGDPIEIESVKVYEVHAEA